jgi:protein SCO1
VARAFLAVLVALVLTGCGSSGSGAPVHGIHTSDHDGYHGALLEEPYAVPDTTLDDTDGKSFDLAAQKRRTLVFFGYTNCPDICQVVMSTIVSALARLSPEEQRQLQVAFITTDPARDTPAKLRSYLDRFDPSYVGLTGPIERIDQMAKRLDVFLKKGHKLPSGGYAVDHSTVVVAVHGGAGDLVWTGGTSPADMAADLEKILAAHR